MFDPLLTEKMCKDCERVRPVAAFHRSKEGKFGYTATCYDCHKKRYGILGPEWRKQRHAKYRESIGWTTNTIQAAKRRAAKANVPCTITSKDILVPDVCPVLGIALVIGNGGMQDNSPTLDRIVPDLGYVPGNVTVISWKANKLKGNNTDPELFEKVAKYIRKHQRASQ